MIAAAAVARVVVRFTVFGSPISRWGLLGDKPSPQRYYRYRGAVFLAAQYGMTGRRPVAGPVGVQIVYRAPEIRPDGHPSPDLDNVIKVILDGMTKVVFNDDRQVQSLMCWRTEADPADECVEVAVVPWSGGSF